MVTEASRKPADDPSSRCTIDATTWTVILSSDLLSSPSHIFHGSFEYVR